MPREMESCGKCRKTANSSEHHFFSATLHLGPAVIIIFGLLINLPPFANSTALPLEAMFSSKRVAFPSMPDLSSDEATSDYHPEVRYDEYPIVVPKRAALILDRILKEIESAKEKNQLINDWSPVSRRGNNKDKLYFRCYFNAVSCYKRK